MSTLPPIHTAALFRPLAGELLALLRGLGETDWTRRTVAGAWRVRDVAVHLLDGDLRKLAAYRDAHLVAPPEPIRSEADVVRLVNGLNAGGVAWGARLSARLVVDLLAMTSEWVADLLESLDPQATSLFPVSWAGERESPQWMDTAREYTERWHHQMQIRDAVGAPLVLLEPRWMRPLLEASVRALPHGFSGVHAAPGASVVLEVTGPTTGTWSVVRDDAAWTVHAGRVGAPAAVVQVTADAAWRLLFNALPDPATDARIVVEGDARLAAPLLRTRSVVV